MNRRHHLNIEWLMFFLSIAKCKSHTECDANMCLFHRNLRNKKVSNNVVQFCSCTVILHVKQFVSGNCSGMPFSVNSKWAQCEHSQLYTDALNGRNCACRVSESSFSSAIKYTVTECVRGRNETIGWHVDENEMPSHAYIRWTESRRKIWRQYTFFLFFSLSLARSFELFVF